MGNLSCRLREPGLKPRLVLVWCRLTHLGHKTEWLTHLTYLGMVGYQADHSYGVAAWVAAGALLLAHLGGTDA